MRSSRSLVVTLLSAMLVIAAPGQSLAAAGAATPEDAVRAYLAGVVHADANAILEASAIEEMATGFRFDLLTERLNAMLPTTTLAPANYPFYADVNRATQSSLLLGQARNLMYSLLSFETIDGSVIAPVEAARAATFVEQVDPARLANLEVLDIRPADPYFAEKPVYLENTAKQAAVYGADEQTERVALVSLDGATYAVGFTLMRFDDSWKVSSQVSNLAGTTSLGTALPMSVAEFDDLTKPN
jgi:hypothetical protein